MQWSLLSDTFQKKAGATPQISRSLYIDDGLVFIFASQQYVKQFHSGLSGLSSLL